MRSFGVKNVDFGGISSPSRAVRSISATLTGRISTAAARGAARDRVDHVVDAVLIGHGVLDIGQHVFEPGAVERADAVEGTRPGVSHSPVPSGPTRQSLPSASMSASVSADGAPASDNSNDAPSAVRNVSMSVPV